MLEKSIKKTGITKNATVHTLRHSFATHLLDDGTDICYIQRLLGHTRITTTTIYLHLRRMDLLNIKSPLDTLLDKKMNKMIEIQDIFNQYGDEYRKNHKLPLHILKTMITIEACRTAELGGHVDECDECGHARISYNSCRDRHCPKCQTLAKERWLEKRKEDLLPAVAALTAREIFGYSVSRQRQTGRGRPPLWPPGRGREICRRSGSGVGPSGAGPRLWDWPQRPRRRCQSR